MSAHPPLRRKDFNKKMGRRDAPRFTTLCLSLIADRSLSGPKALAAVQRVVRIEYSESRGQTRVENSAFALLEPGFAPPSPLRLRKQPQPQRPAHPRVAAEFRATFRAQDCVRHG